MKRVLIAPAIAVALFAAACGNDSDNDPTGVSTVARVRFLNATIGTGSGGFTTNGQFTSGSVLGPGHVAQTCSTVEAGKTIFGFGAANPGGTGLSGNPLATSDEHNIAAGGSYTVVATGSAASPSLSVYSNSLSSELGTDQAAVRFGNFAPNPGTSVYNYVFFRGATVGSGPPLAINLPFNAMSTFSVVPSGASAFSVLEVPGFTAVIEGSAATLSPGSVNTLALVRSASGSLHLMHVPPCS